MAKKIEGQNPTFAAEDVIFNTEKGFAESEIKFDGDYQVSGNKSYVKAVEFPGGKWIGHRALKNILREGAFNALLTLPHYPAKDKESKLWVANLEGNFIHGLFASALMDGMTKEEATEFVVESVVSLEVGFTRESVIEILDCPLCAI